jgi:hypothetical protein
VTVEMSRPREATSVATRSGVRPSLKADHHAVALALGHVAVQGLDVHPLVAQRAVELVAADLGAHEDDRLSRVLARPAPRPALAVLSLGRDLQPELLDRVDGQVADLTLTITGL